MIEGLERHVLSLGPRFSEKGDGEVRQQTVAQIAPAENIPEYDRRHAIYTFLDATACRGYRTRERISLGFDSRCYIVSWTGPESLRAPRYHATADRTRMSCSIW